MKYFSLPTYLFIFLLLLTELNILATNKATVVKLRGKVTKLVPGSLKARLVKVGDIIPQETSVVSYARSFALIQFDDGTKMTIGPRSKIVLNYNKENTGSVVSLLKGKLRSKVKKKQKKNLFITTRTAALGVRGTDFQTIFNPENNVTNLLTFNGEVAMAKIKKGDLKYKTESEKKVIRTKDNKVRVRNVTYEVPVIEASAVKELLEKKPVEIVQAGQFSGTLASHEKISKPVKISPVQLAALYTNETLQDRSGLLQADDQSLSDLKNIQPLEQKEQSAPLEGFYDKKTGDYAPKSGGVIDLETGLYIAPDENAAFDEKKNIYIASNIGAIDSTTGDYLPPKGLKLDANKGFIEDPKFQVKKDSKEKLALAKSTLNKALKKDLVITNKSVKDEILYSSLSLKEKFTKNHFHLNISSYEIETDEKDSTTTYNGRNTFTGATKFDLGWTFSGSGKYRPFVGINFVDANFSEDNGFQVGGDTLFGMKFGADYYISNRLYLKSYVSIQEQLIPTYLDSDDDNNIDQSSLSAISMTKFNIGADYKFATFKRSFYGILTLVNTNFYKSNGDVKVKNGFGLDLKIYAGYELAKHHLVNIFFYNSSMNADISNDLFSSTLSHSTRGLGLNYHYTY